MAAPNWNKIKNEYISSSISQRKLAEKYKVSYNTLKDRAKRENWTKSKDETHRKITSKTQQKTAEKISDEALDFTVDMILINSIAAKRSIEMLNKSELKPSELKNITGALKDISEIQKQYGNNSEKQHNELKQIFEDIDDGVKFDTEKIFSEQTS
jgi:hypothetical protein